MTVVDISVVMVVQDESPFLRKSIDSILDQTVQNTELIILNDGCGEKISTVVKSYKDHRIRFFDHWFKRGMPVCNNEAVSYARSDFIAIQSSNAISKKHRLEMKYSLLVNEIDLFCIGGWVNVVNDEKKVNLINFPPLERDDCYKMFSLQCKNPIIDCTRMMRRECFVDLGKYSLDSGLSLVYDLDLLARALAGGRALINLPEVLVEYAMPFKDMNDPKNNDTFLARMFVWKKFMSDYLKRR